MKSKIIIISSTVLTILVTATFSLINKPGNDYLIYKDSLKFFKNKKYYLFKSEYITPDEKFCNAFLNDFKQNKNIKVIEPVVVTSDINDPNIKKYIGNALDSNQHCKMYYCSLRDLLTKHIEYSPALRKFLYWRKETIIHLYGDEHTAQKFKLYDIDFNNNPKDGKHSFFISQNYTMSRPHNNLDEIKDILPTNIYEVAISDYNKGKYAPDHYFIVDFDIPKIHYYSNLVNYKSPDSRFLYLHHFGIIKYRKKFYYYSLSHREFNIKEMPPKAEWKDDFRIETKCFFLPKKL